MCVCVCVSTILLLKSTLPSPDGAAYFVLLLNSRCHSRPPTCWETAKCPQSIPVVSSLLSACWRPSCPDTPYLNTPAIRRLCMVMASAYLRVCESHYPGVKQEILLFYSCASARWWRFSTQPVWLCLRSCLFIPVGSWLQQAHT